MKTSFMICTFLPLLAFMVTFPGRSHADTWLWVSALDLAIPPGRNLEGFVSPTGSLEVVASGPAWANLHLPLPIPSAITNEAFDAIGTQVTVCVDARDPGITLHHVYLFRVETLDQLPICFTEPYGEVPVGPICLDFAWTDIQPCNTVGTWVLDLEFQFTSSGQTIDLGGIGILLPDPETSGIETDGAADADGLRLRSGPNPLVDSASLEFHLAETTRAHVGIHDVAGRKIRVLADRELPSGDHVFVWDGNDDRGRRVAPGVYFYQVSTELGNTEKAKVVVLR